MRYLCVGWVSQAHGLKGHIFVRLFAGRADWLYDLDVLGFDSMKAKPALSCESPQQILKVSSVRSRPQGLYMQVEAVNDRTKAEQMIGRSVFVSQNLLSSEESEAPFLHELLDAVVLDASGQDWGRVIGFGSNGAQDLLVIQNPTATFELPYVFPLVQSFDREQKKVVVSIPEGLIDLNSK